MYQSESFAPGKSGLLLWRALEKHQSWFDKLGCDTVSASNCFRLPALFIAKVFFHTGSTWSFCIKLAVPKEPVLDKLEWALKNLASLLAGF